MTFEEYAKTLNFQPLYSFPWDREDAWTIKVPSGVVLKKACGTVWLIGDEVSGQHDSGCGCCSTSWAAYDSDGDGYKTEFASELDFVAWAWVWDVTVFDKPHNPEPPSK